MNLPSPGRGFHVTSPFRPMGDQGEAIESLVTRFQQGQKTQTLLGVTGSGKTFTFSKVIERMGVPTLIMTHNKTLAGQIYTELTGFFPENKVCYYVSYYDYYQPEAYIPQSDTYIEKDASINEDIDRMRLEAITSLLTRRDVIVVASVSAIYGVGSPQDYKASSLRIRKGVSYDKMDLLRDLIGIFYQRNDIGFYKGEVRTKGDIIDIYPPYENNPVRVALWGDEVDDLYYFDNLTGSPLAALDEVEIFPAKYFVTSEENLKRSLSLIRQEMEERVSLFREEGKLLEAQRLEMRTKYDLEMLENMGYCSGIENYSRYLTGRAEGERPYVLLDYFPGEFLMIIDESHISLPQIRGMYNGDRARKQKLVDFGFRLPSALDNRPLYFEEFESMLDKALFVSATPGDYEKEKSTSVVEQIIRPTGLLDPVIEVRPTEGQVYDLMTEAREIINRGDKILVTTLTKKMAEDLTAFLKEKGFKADYLHSEIHTFERIETLNSLRLGEFDVLVGINLLREGLDLPEVSTVFILDADKEGFLRSFRSLIQISGRVARNSNGHVIMYADRITDSMKAAIDETSRRRSVQEDFNRKHGITPQTIRKAVSFSTLLQEKRRDKKDKGFVLDTEKVPPESIPEAIETLTELMKIKSEQLLFEEAAKVRDAIFDLRKKFEERMKI
ncbi:MAG TPA: excinuclease ABC subunit UvrB [Firmicutes bacterium]|nr:excinuclease ABC subunit UvrB [Bacillota bacterium]